MTASDAPASSPPAARYLRELLHDFHLTGRAARFPDPLRGAPLEPLAFQTVEETPPAFPLSYRETGPASFRPLHELLDEILRAGAFDLLGQRAALLARAAGSWLAAAGKTEGSLADALGGALREVERSLVLPDQDQAAFQAESQRLLAQLPQARVINDSAAAAVLLHARTLLAVRGKAQKRLTDRIRGLLQRMEGLLGRGDQPESAEELASELGAQASRFLDAASLAGSLRRTAAHRPLDPRRRERIAQAARQLRSFLERVSSESLVTLFHRPDGTAVPPMAGLRYLHASDPVKAAHQQAQEDWAWFSDVLRAVRTASLEAQNDYAAEIHDRALQRFDWTAATQDEAAAAPLSIVVDTLPNLADRGLADWSRAMRSGLPLQVLALRDAGVAQLLGETSDDLRAAPLPDLGYLAIAHRDVFVLEAPLVEIEVVRRGFERMSRSLRPALAVVSVSAPNQDPAAALERHRAAWRARLAPVLLYDPDGGESWAARFSLDGNVDPARTWAAGSPADAAALDPACRDHFLVLPSDAPDAEQTPLDDYLAGAVGMPYILVKGPNGEPARAIITRRLANLCRDARQAWRIYQELAGVHNEYVEAATAAAQSELDEQFHQEQEQRSLADRRAGAEAAIYRLVASLAGAERVPPAAFLSVAEAVQSTATPEPRPADASSAAPAAASQPQAEPQPDRPPEPTGPYIESALCTSCNECINRNPKMFRYNENQQAYIADPKAGTYKQLVKAAAACPARCIHPGPPPE